MARRTSSGPHQGATPAFTPQIEEHPLGFFLPENAKILMLGSFPPKRERWSMNFYYPNIQNDMWRIMGLLFYGNKEQFVITEAKRKPRFNEQLIKEFCIEKGIALGDTAVKVKRLKDNASDKFLEIVEHLDIANILKQIPHCHTIIVTGEKAMNTLLGAFAACGITAEAPKVGEYTVILFSQHQPKQPAQHTSQQSTRQIKLYRMPSSSRAYPKPLEEKAAYYQKALSNLKTF